MFGLFHPSCPLNAREKAWTELRMSWLAETLSLDRLRRATIVLPTAEFLPEAFNGETPDLQKVFDRVCGYMQVEPAEIDLDTFDDSEQHQATGFYLREHPETGRPTIGVAEAQLDDPTGLVATMAHELAHHILLGGELQQGDEADMEEVTDLLPLYLGMGVFAANSVLRERFARDANWHVWSLGRSGYLPGRIHGYGLALFGHARGDFAGDLAKHLRLDVSDVFRKGVKYLSRTGDSVFPRALNAGEPSLPGLLDDLESGTPSCRMVAMWTLVDRGDESQAFVDLLQSQVEDGAGDATVRVEAVRVLGQLGPRAASATEPLLDLLPRRSEELRCAAAVSLGRIGAEPERAAAAIGEQMLSDERNFTLAGVRGLADLGTWPEEMGNHVARHVFDEVGRVVRECQFEMARHLLAGLMQALPDFRPWLSERLEETDPEVAGMIQSITAEAAEDPSMPLFDNTRRASLTRPVRSWNRGYR